MCMTFKRIQSEIERWIEVLNHELKQNGAAIESKSGPGNGYRLIINNQTPFDQYYLCNWPQEVIRDCKDFNMKIPIRFIISIS